MFPNISTQSAQSEFSQDNCNLEEHEGTNKNSESVDDKAVNCETDAQEFNLEVQESPEGTCLKLCFSESDLIEKYFQVKLQSRLMTFQTINSD